ncbi:hypothetical protein AALO_G00149600 [Alosa alosa]|uniref:Doublecortin domain-containing protein n=1 Tax=Alosa alosa TaxID=278164 RepID=A0AAV6GIV6_9TELE|nr:doublecortin domain-containing protein 1-like [Alosa alosa]KAG5273277.1 hypothetical protein AALO_G00149600 [Alosa alosa]
MASLTSRSSSRSGSSRATLQEVLMKEYNTQLSAPPPPTLPRKFSSPYASKVNKHRPVSAPASKHRFSKPCEEPPVYLRQPQRIRVTAYKNGSRVTFTKVTASNIATLLEDCTLKLRLNSAARRVFLADGTEAHAPEDIPQDADVFISTGEAFVDPLAEIRAHLSVNRERSWTLRGLVQSGDGHQRGGTRASGLSRRALGRLCQALPTAQRVLIFKNGAGRDGREVSTTTTTQSLEQFLDVCTEKLHLTTSAKIVFNWNGKVVEDLDIVPQLDGCLLGSGAPVRGPLWASRGEAFSAAGAQTYVRDTAKALRQRLGVSRQHLEQLESVEASRTEDVTSKEILSFTGTQRATAREKAQAQIKELEDCLRNHQQQLSILGRMVEEESSSPASSKWPLSQGPPLPQGLQLKVYQRGRDSGHTLVFVSRVELEKGTQGDEERMMDRLLQVILGRLGAGATGSPYGWSLSPAWICDEQGEAVRSPLHLQSGQRVWLSYGEDHRLSSSVSSAGVLTLSLEKVATAVDVDHQAIHKTLLDPDVDHEKYHASEEFPKNHTAHPTQWSLVKTSPDTSNHYLQLKENPAVVFLPSVTVAKHATADGPTGQTGGAESSWVWPSLAHVWSIQKTGEIVSCAFPQLCLAASPVPITLRVPSGEETQAHMLLLQKREMGCPFQRWRFGENGHIYSEALSELTLTYLQEECGWAEVTPQHQGAIERPRGREGADGRAYPEPIEAAPTDSPWGEAASQGAQLSVALLRQHKGKQAPVAAQRWAIRPDRCHSKERGRRSSTLKPPWRQQGYVWPVLPCGEINEDLMWPLEGALVPSNQPFPLSGTRGHQSFTPLRLRVLRNGQVVERTKATSVTLPNITSSRMRSQVAKSKGSSDNNTEDQNVEFQEFLNRCTELLKLPSVARRLFEEDGKEAFQLTGLQRDQLVYVSCGEPWVSPQRRQAEAHRRLAVLRLEWDVACIRHYCALRSPQDLVLDVEGQPQEGSAVLVRPYCLSPEDTTPEQSQASSDTSDFPLGDTHWRAHQRADERVTQRQWPWQQRGSQASSYGEDDSINEDTSVKKDKSRLGGHRQQFEWAKGQLVSCRSPWLAVGVRAREGSSADLSSSPLHLLPRNPLDPHQVWISREGERTLHLQADPNLVLAVSMPQIPYTHQPATIPTGWPVILQKHKPHSPTAAAANQRWRWLPEQRVLCAFYTDVLEQELTAACLASVCTSCVYPQPLLQQGYCWSSPGGEERVEVCVSCATELRGKVHLKRLPANSTFRCATANRNPRLNPKGAFRSLSVCETDLSTEAADATLQRLEENLDHLKRQCPGQTTKTQSPRAGRSGSTQLPVRILAHRNGQTQKEAQLVTAATMPLLLTEGTRRLGLPRAALHFYTADGTRILTIQQLKAWALNQSLQEHQPLTDTDTRPHTHMTAATLSGEAALEGGADHTEAQALPLVTEAEVDTVDQALLALVLREPIPVWMSCGEPFQPPDVMKQKEMQRVACWMEKEKLFLDLEIRRHKMRQQKARPPQLQSPSRQIPQTVERASETTADLNASETCIRVEESMQDQGSKPVQEGPSSSTHDHYYQPKVKRVLVHCNGGDITKSIYVWGRTIDELLSCSSERLGLPRPASLLYTMLGEPVTSWAHIQRDALLCVAAGEPFLTPKDCRDRIEMKANFARAIRHHRLTTSGMAVKLKELQTISVEHHSR